MAKYIYRTITAHFDTHGKRRFDHITYWWMSEKFLLSLLKEEGWELVIVTPIAELPVTINDTEEIKRHESKYSLNNWFPWRKKKSPDFLIKNGMVGEAYIFKRLKQE